MRANLDGSEIESLVDTSQGDPPPDPGKWCKLGESKVL
jgi:hypothetical protein